MARGNATVVAAPPQTGNPARRRQLRPSTAAIEASSSLNYTGTVRIGDGRLRFIGRSRFRAGHAPSFTSLRVDRRFSVVRGQDYIGPYRLLNLIMTGQTSQVWEAMDDRSQSRVALKMLLSDWNRDREHIAYLKHEHAVGRGLDHPRVVRMLDLGNFKGTVYVTMEYFPYPNLKQSLNQGVETIAPDLTEIITQAAEGLAYFNEKGWVHRDVKPDNFLLKPEPDVRLIDFALAQRTVGAIGKFFARKTKIQGTRSYMSPEQIRGKPLDVRADIYSFGCMAYELVAGKTPFTGVSSNELLNKHLRAPPPSLESNDPNVKTEFADLIRRTMAKSPDRRPASMREFLTEYRGIGIFRSPPRRPATQENTG